MGRAGVRGVVFFAALVGVLVLPARAAGSGHEQRLWLEAKNRALHQQRATLSDVARRAMPAVVSITTRQGTAETAVSGEEPQKGIGSGFIIHPDGYILTSAHVVEGATEVSITVLHPRGGVEEYPARVVGQDERTDCALLKIEARRRLPVLKLASATHVRSADWIVVIGNPFGLSHSVTVGVVSYMGRTDVTPNGRDGDFDYMQMDASINPGNSGGPVLDLHGDVVAVANAVNVAGQGIGFAIPIDIAKTVIPQLKAHGRVRRGWMGISVQDFSPEVADAYNLPRGRGVVVTEVAEGGPGERAGLHAGDVIVGLDSRSVSRAHTLRWQVAARGVGRPVHLKVQRIGRPLRVTVKLEEMPAEEAPAPTLAANRPERQPTRGQSVLEDLLSPVPRTRALPGRVPPPEADDDTEGSGDGEPEP
ncbi:trypsin-like peptidase domain-containing protein [Pyxidicoccus parkwayensis]|uniref:Trypsin-like peptidase domain-containing protein n=1 Tax=Pyxidicoccus parkwayensis TaxID=2813578 RepID=A0ABX7NK24_9BACT|nr:trypsin-like peptidase domain-containing protein [Pyxidicoccus parkwaysis]QSQ19212.1 trypsin-like peptidase domain-containing protein [Pyxidicoccus parkwaysis]